MSSFKNTLVQVTRFGMGHGDEALAIKLMGNYFKLILDDNRLPKIITFYNEGVKLLTEKSPVLETLKTIEQRGVTLVACKTCLDYYGLTDSMGVGITGTMMDIITLQTDADKVVTL
ncbi:sulfurtransferase-like selenium metabolism protein YedF [Marinilabiliaceae bacterium JC017]|nr:sulfurtransferase-like selenium metabolism protein YedF [Marinilabiliaceae bacterium JC017]